MSFPSSDQWQSFVAGLHPEIAVLHEQPLPDVLITPDGGTVTVQDLLEVLRQQTAPVDSGRRRLRSDRYGPGLFAAAWRHTTFRQARAVLSLFQADLAAEAQANARAGLEHAVLLQRVALAADQDELEPLLLALAQDQRRHQDVQLDYLADLDDRTGAQYRPLLEAARAEQAARQVPTDKSRPSVRTVKAHFQSLPNGLNLHSVYSTLSNNTHAGLASATPYLLPALRDDQPVPAQPEAVRWAEALALLCWSCWAADDAMRRFLVDGDDLAQRHDTLLGQIGLTIG